jgi:D-3-phosphoglycerate dehydrogenase
VFEVLISCLPMINQRRSFEEIFQSLGVESTWAQIVQQYTEQELIQILPEFDGWIVGDDPCTREVLSAGTKVKLKAIVK